MEVRLAKQTLRSNMSKTIKIEIKYDPPLGEDLSAQEIKETIDALRNSLLSQVGGLAINMSEE